MTPWPLRYSPRARRDIAEIYNDLEDRSAPSAEDWLRRLHQRCERLRLFPHLGRPRPDIMPGIRSLLVDEHLVFYRLRRDRVEVGRVVHQRRDLSRLRWPAS